MMRGRIDRVFGVAVFVAFSLFLVRRALRVPLTYDEAASYLKFVRADVFSLFNFAWATNHFLSTVIARLFCFIGGDNELMLRMPGLIGYGLYVWFSVLVLRLVSNRAIAIAGLLLLNLNPYLLDYFALSRGYGLWLGLQMGMLYFAVRFVALVREDRQAEAARALSRALTCATGAVLANIAAFNVDLSIVAIAAIAFAVTNRRTPDPAPHVPHPAPRFVTALPFIVAAGFSALVFSQDLELSPMIYEHVSVALTGVTGEDAPRVAVVRTNVHNRAEPLQRHGVSWLMVGRENATGLSVQVPLDVAPRLETITVRIGERVFEDDLQRVPLNWTIRDEGGKRLYDSAPSLSLPRPRLTSFRSIINHHGGVTHALYAIGHAGIFLLAMAGFALATTGVGWIAGRLRLVTRGQWGVLQRHALWVAAVAGAPMYLLVRDGELGFGEADGVVPAIRDLADSLFYGHVYRPDQIHIALAITASAAAVGAVALIAGYRRRGHEALLPTLTVLSVIVTVATILGAERLFLDSPYPMGRTALFIVPLCVLEAIFVLDAIARLNRIGTLVASIVMIAAVVAAAAHFRVTANVTSTEDWPYDVETKHVIADLGRAVAEESHDQSPVRLATYWLYWPAASVYARWNTSARIDVVEEPGPSRRDFVYVRAGELPPGARVMKAYPAADGVLARIVD